MGISAATDPCRDGDYKIPDPYNCKKFWLCKGGSNVNNYTCTNGYSFSPKNSANSCTGPPPSQVKGGCWKVEG